MLVVSKRFAMIERCRGRCADMRPLSAAGAAVGLDMTGPTRLGRRCDGLALSRQFGLAASLAVK
jgi:hypothetical protein